MFPLKNWARKGLSHGCISDIAKTIAPTMVYSFKHYNLQRLLQNII